MAFLHFSFNPNETFLGTIMIRTKFDPQLGDKAASKNDIGFVEKNQSIKIQCIVHCKSKGKIKTLKHGKPNLLQL